jgi:hypothetical protein
VFVTQLANRAQEKLVLAKAMLSTSKKASYEAVIGTQRDEEQTIYKNSLLGVTLHLSTRA